MKLIAGLLMQVQPVNICNNKQLFLEFHSSEGPQHVILGDDHSLSATCTGNIAIKLLLRNGKTRECHLSDDLMSSMCQIIIEFMKCIKELKQEKVELNFTDCQIVDQEGKVVAVGIRKGIYITQAVNIRGWKRLT